MFLAISILLAGLIFLICKAAANTKLEMRNRVLHIRYVIVTLIYVIVCVCLFVKILNLINLVVSIPFVQTLLFSIVPPGNVSASFYWIITLLCCLLLSLGHLLIISLLRRLWLLPLSKKNYLETNNILEKFFNAIAELFYAFRGDTAVLTAVNYNHGRWIRAMRRGFGLFLAGETLFISLYLSQDLTFLGVDFFALLVKSLYMLPVLTYCLLEQVELFLAADRTKDDILTDTEEIGMLQQGNFSGLAQLYQRLFGEKSLIASYPCNSKSEIQESMFSGAQAEQKAQVKSPELLESLCRNVECVTTLSPHYVNGLVDLINGQNIAVFDTPWGEFDPYYLSYVQHRLTLGESVLVLCDNKLQVHRMIARLRSIFTKLNVVTPIWRIHSIATVTDSKVDILVCTEEEFLANPISEQYPHFNEHLGVVVMLDTYGLLCRESSFSSRIFDFFFGRQLQYIFYIPENNTDIRHQLQLKIGCSEIRLRENPRSSSSTHLMFWRSDAIYKPQLAISPRLYEDFGVAYALAIIAAKHDVSSVNILAPESVPLQTYYHLVTQKYTSELLEDYLKSHAINLSTTIRNNDYSVTEPAQLNFCVVYDELNNSLDVAQTWTSYGGAASSMLHIISGPYMLRDYLASNISTLSAEVTGLQMLIPKNPVGQKMPAMALLMRMRRGVLCQEILRFARDCRIGSDRLEHILQIALDLVFGPHHHYSVYNNFSFTECDVPDFHEGYHYTVTVTLINEALYQTLCAMTEEFAHLTGAHSEVLPIHRQDIYNHYLPRQQLVCSNNRYRVHTIANGNVQVIPEGTVAADLFYTPIYDIIGLKRTNAPMQPVPKNNKVVMDYFEATVTRQTTGYYAHPGMLDLTDKEATHLETLVAPIVETKTVPCLQMAFSCPMKNRSDKIANTLCFLLKGALATFVPKNYKDLLVFSKLDMDQVCQGVTFQSDTGLLPDPIPSDLLTDFDKVEPIDPAICNLIPKVSDGDVLPNTADKLYIYIVQFSALDTGVLTAIAADLDRILGTILEYLTWSEKQKIGAPEYLRFGYDDVPGIFSTNDTVFCLPSFFDHVPNSNSTPAGSVQISDSEAKYCSFCGKSVSVSYVELDDGRVMCKDCHSHITNSREEVKELLQLATDTLSKHYGITLPSGIKVKFKSASAIRKRASTTGGRVLGFYNLKHREIWIERNGPKPCVLSILLHELTHAWQHANINMDIDLAYLEGHTSYVEVECMRLLRQGTYAEFLDSSLTRAEDEYGKGYRYWKACLRDDSDKNLFNHMRKRFPKE